MSWLATKYAWKCQNPLVKGGTRLVFLAIASRVRKKRITTVPTSLPQLQALTLMSAEQIRRCIDALGDSQVGEVRRLNRGKLAIYGLPKMAGPLFVVDSPEKPVKMTDFVFEPPRRKTGQDDRKPTPEMTGKNRAFGRAVPEVSSFSDRSTNNRVPPTTQREAEATLIARTHEFLEWWAYAYPLYNDGALSTVQVERHGPLVHDLLLRRPIGQLKNMAVVLWKVDVRDEPWIAEKSDRSLYVLKHKADWLDRRLTKVADWWVACPHTPKCDQRALCDGQAQEAVS